MARNPMPYSSCSGSFWSGLSTSCDALLGAQQSQPIPSKLLDLSLTCCVQHDCANHFMHDM